MRLESSETSRSTGDASVGAAMVEETRAMMARVDAMGDFILGLGNGLELLKGVMMKLLVV